MDEHGQQRNDSLSRRQALRLLGFVSLSAIFGPAASAEAKKAKKKRYKILFKLNKGKNPKSQVKSIEAGKKLSIKKLKKPSRHGYSFKGWFTDKALTKKAKRLKGKKRAATRTVYAKWALATYKITYALGGGSLLFDLPTSYTCLSSTIALTGAVKSGHSFGGWYSDKKLTTAVKSIPAGSAGNMTLYAKWNASGYWDKHLAAKTKRINELSAQIGTSGTSLVFITDIHYPENVGFSPELIKRVVSSTSVDHVVCGGDINRYESPKKSALERLL